MATREAGVRTEAPGSVQEAAELMRRSGAERLRVRPVGAGTKLGWGTPTPEPDLELSTRSMREVLEHNEGDFTVRVQPGLPVAELQRTLADARQMLALDPPLGAGDGATVGGMIAAGDSGPFRHRYGGPRDLILGVTVVLSDGTVAKAGGKVIKNVAGYDLPKLFTGSFGTLGLIAELALRLHPRPASTASATAGSDDPAALARAARALSHSSLEMDCLDVRWEGDQGAVMARFGGAAAQAAAERALPVLREAGLEPSLLDDDAELWARQRAAQRSAEGAVVRVSGLQSRLADVFEATARAGGSVVGRAGHGLSWVHLPARPADDMVASIERLRAELSPMPCVVLDAPREVRSKLDVWGVSGGSALELMRRLKPRFDPDGVCNPGVYIGGI